MVESGGQLVSMSKPRHVHVILRNGVTKNLVVGGQSEILLSLRMTLNCLRMDPNQFRPGICRKDSTMESLKSTLK